ncbi:unnamed protein product [Vitrella brassicaformis CCMP3155]|uniref:Uncharacterized protein n=1 Tax=Vitrella brassicaformis (strain CCMP3155) TaxID=1169540 RepID=A0A0G4FT36_VITBC|nr:unnamed protein product [Vitrella brassicaformis CCMP3155]|eukprot:CEM17522.1 unnamed protein product [Vitrella brassicaformis CCMP3155]
MPAHSVLKRRYRHRGSPKGPLKGGTDSSVNAVGDNSGIDEGEEPFLVYRVTIVDDFPPVSPLPPNDANATAPVMPPDNATPPYQPLPINGSAVEPGVPMAPPPYPAINQPPIYNGSYGGPMVPFNASGGGPSSNASGPPPMQPMGPPYFPPPMPGTPMGPPVPYAGGPPLSPNGPMSPPFPIPGTPWQPTQPVASGEPVPPPAAHPIQAYPETSPTTSENEMAQNKQATDFPPASYRPPTVMPSDFPPAFGPSGPPQAEALSPIPTAPTLNCGVEPELLNTTTSTTLLPTADLVVSTSPSPRPLIGEATTSTPPPRLPPPHVTTFTPPPYAAKMLGFRPTTTGTPEPLQGELTSSSTAEPLEGEATTTPTPVPVEGDETTSSTAAPMEGVASTSSTGEPIGGEETGGPMGMEASSTTPQAPPSSASPTSTAGPPATPPAYSEESMTLMPPVMVFGGQVAMPTGGILFVDR